MSAAVRLAKTARGGVTSLSKDPENWGRNIMLGLIHSLVCKDRNGLRRRTCSPIPGNAFAVMTEDLWRFAEIYIRSFDCPRKCITLAEF